MTKALNISKRIVAIVVIALMMIVAMVPSVYADDFDGPVTLTARFEAPAKNVPGIALYAYKVASMDKSANFVVSPVFEDYQVDFSQLDDQSSWRSLAQTLHAYIMRDGIEADAAAVTDATGTASFGTVEPGLYVVLAKTQTIYDNKVYTVDTSMVVAPMLDENGKWVRDCVFAPKHTVRDLPTTPDTEGYKVIKLWNDEGVEGVTRPDGIDVELICDGKVIDTVNLNKNNGWAHEWDLEAGKTYSVTEKNVPDGYTVSIGKEAKIVTITNTATPPPPPPDNPPKNPPSNPPTIPSTGVPWIPAIVLAAAGILFFVAGVVRRGKETE